MTSQKITLIFANIRTKHYAQKLGKLWNNFDPAVLKCAITWLFNNRNFPLVNFSRKFLPTLPLVFESKYVVYFQSSFWSNFCLKNQLSVERKNTLHKQENILHIFEDCNKYKHTGNLIMKRLNLFGSQLHWERAPARMWKEIPEISRNPKTHCSFFLW